MSSGSIRIIQLPEKSSVNTDDYMAVDSSANGTKKVKFTDLLDDNLSASNKAANAQATGEAINNISARVDNMINTQTNAEVTTLWTGQINLKNETANLSESINNFDFIDVYCGGVDTVFARQHVSGSSVYFELQSQNMSDDASVQFMRWWETGLTISGTTATIKKAIKCFWDNFSTAPIVSQATGGGIDIVRIDGVKIGHVENDEIVDARVGVDGTSYPTLGDAIRGQVTDLKSEYNQFMSFAYAMEYLTQFESGIYKWYPLEVANGTVLKLKTVDGSDYINGNLLLYDGYAGTHLGTISGIIDGDTATFTINQDGVKYIRTGADFSHGATNVYKVVNGYNAKTKIRRLEARNNESITDIKHLFGFEFGDLNSQGVFVDSKRRMATPDVHIYDFDIVIAKRSGASACYLITFSDENGSNPRHIGIINQDYDYLLMAGTYFKLIIYNPDNLDLLTGDKYDNIIYNSFRAYNQTLSRSLVRSGDYKDTYLYNKNVRSVCHRGANRLAPENTLPAFIMARKIGFEWVEADIAFTHDNVCVILHDTTIDRTSNGTGNIADLDYADIENLDFGSWFSPAYAGTKIPTLDEFLQCCRKIGLNARLDINHNISEAQLTSVCEAVVKNGMLGHAEFIGYSPNNLAIVKNALPTTTLIYLVPNIISQHIDAVIALRTGQNDVHLLTDTIDSTVVNLCADARVPLEYWTAGTESAILNLDPYVSVVTTEGTNRGEVLVAGYILYKSVIAD